MKIFFDVDAANDAYRRLIHARSELDALAMCSSITLPAEAPAAAAAAIEKASELCRTAARTVGEQAQVLRRRLTLAMLANQAAATNPKLAMHLTVLAAGSEKTLAKIVDSPAFKGASMTNDAAGLFLAANQQILLKHASYELKMAAQGTKASQLGLVLKSNAVTLKWAGKIGKIGGVLGVVGGAMTAASAYSTSVSTGISGKVVTAGVTTAITTALTPIAAAEFVTGGKVGVSAGTGNIYGALVDGALHHNTEALEAFHQQSMNGKFGDVYKGYSSTGELLAKPAGSLLDKGFGKNWPWDGDGRPW